MRGGLTTAARWSQYYAEQEERYGQQALDHIRAHAEQIKALPQFQPLANRPGDWTIFYEWMKATAPAILRGMFDYGCGRAYHASIAYEEFKRIAYGR